MTNQLQISQRIDSIDILRGITILVMLFVNDVAGVIGTPGWMKHFPAGTDGMTFVDVVFPAFLFIVGMSLPFAMGRRFEKGDTAWQIWKHILIRTLGLLVIGVLMVNSETIAKNEILNPHLWTLLMYVGVILVWNQKPREKGPKYKTMTIIQVGGVILLVIMALLYRGNQETGLIQLRTQWWGILGLIGWAYLVACFVYLLLKNNLAGLVGVVGLLYCVFMADKAGYFANLTWLNSWLNIGAVLGSHPAIVISGVIMGIILKPDSFIKTHKDRNRWAFLYGLGLSIAAILLHSLNDIHKIFIIDKNMATPSWCLLSSAFTIWIWIAIYWLVDVRKWNSWTMIVKPAGANALFAYILAPIFYSLFELFALILNGFNFYSELGNNFAIGFWRSLIFAFCMTWLAGGFRHVGIKLKL